MTLRRAGHGAVTGSTEGRGALMEDEVYETPSASPISLCRCQGHLVLASLSEIWEQVNFHDELQANACSEDLSN